MILDELVIDRTQDDVDAVKALLESNIPEDQKIELLSDMKGAYNASDMNRVEEAVEFVAAVLTAVNENIKAEMARLGVASDGIFMSDINVPPMTIKKDWTIDDIVDESSGKRYIDNIKAVVRQIAIAVKIPDTIDRLTFGDANIIEAALREEYDAALIEESSAIRKVNYAAEAFVYSDEFSLGEGFL